MRKRELIERCERLEAQVRSRGLATDEELAQYRPAGRRAEAWDWTWFYAQLVRFCGRLENRELESAEADGLVIAALKAEPREITLIDSGSRIAVHPKSFEALLNVHARDQHISWLAARYAVCRQTVNPAETVALLERTGAELAYQQQLMVWTATTPGPGLPFRVEDERPAPPDTVRAIGSWDIVRVHQAFIDVNVSRLQAMEKLIQPTRDDAGGGRPSWSVFLGSMALKWKVDPQRLMRDYALIQLLAVAKVASMTGAGADVEEEVGV